MPLVVVDAENVRRSIWPNLSATELVARTRVWAEHEGHELLVVFDGRADNRPRHPRHDRVVRLGAAPGEHDLTGAHTRQLGDLIVAAVDGAESPVWVVTSDRELRRRVEERAERILGGGSFVRSI